MIKHQTQPTPLSCVTTCLAMLLDVPAEQLVEEYDGQYHADPYTLPAFMESKGIGFECRRTEEPICWDSVYLATVPSANIPYVNHQVIIDARLDPIKVYDPADGYGEDRKSYYMPMTDGSQRSEDVGKLPLKGWVLDYCITHAPAIGITSGRGAGNHRLQCLQDLREFALQVIDGKVDEGLYNRVSLMVQET